jgi:hypothetical protein
MAYTFKSYTIIYFSACLSIIMIVAATNFFVDPAHIFGSHHYEKSIARFLADGKNVANISNYDDRLLQKYYIEDVIRIPDIIVLGSSRSLHIASGQFPGKSFFNNSVPGATIEDYLALYELYVERGVIPKTIIIGVDPWILNKNNGQNRWETIKSYYQAMMDRLHIKNNVPAVTQSQGTLQQDKLAQLINLEYFIESLKCLRQDRHIYPTGAREGDVMIKLADGSISYDKPFRERSPMEVMKSAAEFDRDVPYSLGGFKELDPGLRATLEKFIDRLKADGVRVILFLAPYHPVAYENLRRSHTYGSIMQEAETYFRDLARRKGIQVLGSYNPSGWCAPEEFYDGMHPKKICLDRLFAPLAAD